jgi:hypothetical protein
LIPMGKILGDCYCTVKVHVCSSYYNHACKDYRREAQSANKMEERKERREREK